jgi:hypothetical protein
MVYGSAFSETKPSALTTIVTSVKKSAKNGMPDVGGHQNIHLIQATEGRHDGQISLYRSPIATLEVCHQDARIRGGLFHV